MRLQKIAALAFSFTLTLGLTAQDSPEKKLHFHSAFEAAVFEKMTQGDTNLLALMLAAEPGSDSSTYRQASLRVQSLLDDLNPDKIRRYRPRKKVKKIYKAVNRELLKRYELENQVAHTFSEGRYNCVASSLIFVLLFEEFGIPYLVVETPDHVYPIAKFEDESIAVEGTDPKKGFLPLTGRYYRKQLEALIEQNLITEEDLNDPNLDEILDELFPSEAIDITSLIANQYLNASIYRFEAGDYHTALHYARKASAIVSRSRYREMEILCLANILENLPYENPHYPRYLRDFYLTDTAATSRKAVAEELQLITYQYVTEENQPERADSILEPILPYLDRVHREITTKYLLQQKAEREIHFGLPELAFSFARKALHLDPQSNTSLKLFVACFQARYSRVPPGDLTDSIRLYREQFPALEQNNLWLAWEAENLLQAAFTKLGHSYHHNVDPYFEAFEKLAERLPLTLISAELIDRAYSRWALANFNKSRHLALDALQRGQKYAPGQPNLENVSQLIRQ